VFAWSLAQDDCACIDFFSNYLLQLLLEGYHRCRQGAIMSTKNNNDHNLGANHSRRTFPWPRDGDYGDIRAMVAVAACAIVIVGNCLFLHLPLVSRGQVAIGIPACQAFSLDPVFYTGTIRKVDTTLAMATTRVGLVGLPNVGKSTLFNAIAKKADLARAENFPFCTIDPNKAPVAIPDPHLSRLSTFGDTQKVMRPANIQFVDVAGLVEGASRGEGLGNRFLAVVRECQVVVHVLRYFSDDAVVVWQANATTPHPTNKTTAAGTTTTARNMVDVVDPVFDAAIVNHELIQADLAHVEKRLSRIAQTKRDNNESRRGGVGDGSLETTALTKALGSLQRSIPTRYAGLTPEEEFSIKSMGLLTLKPVVYAFNVDEMDFTAHREQTVAEIQTNLMPKIRSSDNNINDNHEEGIDDTIGDDASDQTNDFVLVSAKLEQDLLSLEGPREQSEFISELMSMGKNKKNNVNSFDADADNHGIGSSLTSKDEGQEQYHDYYQSLLSYHVLPTLVCKLLSLSLCYTGPGVPPERSQTTKSYLFSNANNNEPKTSTTSSSSSSSSRGGNGISSTITTTLTAFELAGKIHGDLQKGFLRAEVISAELLLRYDSLRQARDEGCVRTEGKEYAIQDGDVVLIKWREG